MASVEEFEFDSRDHKVFRDCWQSYDLEDDFDCDHFGFVLMALALFLAQKWDPYHVIGVLHCTINHIYRSLEEDDE